ncbi:MAG TPA: hypothetical protein VHL78_05255 [Actinomycetota bacterium]|nr:hypothetical protein [Actinomycetota bacterium]
MVRRTGSLLVALGVWAMFAVAAPASSHIGSADLVLEQVGPPTATVGSDVIYELTVTNGGPDHATGVTVADELPTGMVLASATTDRGTCTGSHPVVCDVGTLDPGEAATVIVKAEPTVGGVAVNEALASSTSPDPVMPNNASAVTTLVTQPLCTITGTDGDDVLIGTPLADVICGLGGNDVLDGLGGDDELYGDSGDDELIGGSGADLLDGADGNDTADYSSAAGGIDLDLSAGTASGQGTDELAGIENAVGGPKNDILVGKAAANALSGGDGVDLLYGKAGPDSLAGGSDGDYLHGGPDGDDLDGGAGMDACVSGKRTSCLSTSPSDGNDARGKLDVKKVKTSFGQKPAWRVIAREKWSLSGMWDEGFVLVYLDTKAGSAPDFYAMARSDGSKMRGRLYAIKGGIDTFKSTVTVTRPTAKTVRIKVSLGKVDVGPARAFYRWSVQTMAIGPCAKVCFDFAPGGGALVQPL